MATDHYKTLGLRRCASDEEIRQAYKKMALFYHPDKNHTPGAEDMFKVIGRAYEVLNDKTKRQNYDFCLGKENVDATPKQHKTNGFHRNSGTANDPFSSFKSGGDTSFSNFGNVNRKVFFTFTYTGFNNSNNQQQQQMKIPLIQKDLPVSLKEVLKGCIKKKKIVCNTLMPDGRTYCKQAKVLTVKVEPGSRDGTRIVLPKEGHCYPNTEPADVVFVVRDRPHNLFKRDNQDVKYTHYLDFMQVLYGGKIEIPTLTDDKIIFDLALISMLKSTRRFFGRGLPDPDNLKLRGDFVVTFEIVIPDIISDSTKNFIINTLKNTKGYFTKTSKFC